MISRGAAPISAATLRARGFDAIGRRETQCMRGRGRVALRFGSVRHSAMAAATRGSTGVVAA